MLWERRGEAAGLDRAGQDTAGLGRTAPRRRAEHGAPLRASPPPPPPLPGVSKGEEGKREEKKKKKT